MPRIARLHSVVPGAPHHVILRGNNRRRLFSYDGCYLRFLAHLRAASLRCDVLIHGFALLTNHVHLVVTAPDALRLATFVQRTAQPYAHHRNRARGGTGKLFEQRYVAVPISGVAQLAATLAYVDLNPVRAGLVREATEYRWSTCALHAGRSVPRAVREAWTPHDWYLGLGADEASREAGYRALLASRTEAELEAVAVVAFDRDDEARASRRREERPDGTCAQ